LTNFAELADGEAVLIDEDEEEDGWVISVDLAAGAGLGDFTSSAANAEPIIRPLMAVVIMSFFSMVILLESVQKQKSPHRDNVSPDVMFRKIAEESARNVAAH
jgi:hypothetical protein